jgi:hypothetical protein
MTLKQIAIVAITIILLGIVPSALFMAYAWAQDICWTDTPLSSRTWLIVFSIDWLLCFTVHLGILLYSGFFSGKTFGSGHSLNWYWTSALIWLFDIGWLAAVSTQISHFTLAACNEDIIIVALVLLALKLLWTPFALFLVCMGA